MNLLTRNEIIDHLTKTKATESELAEINGNDMSYFTIYPNTETDIDFKNGYLATTFIKCSDGYFSLPVYSYDANNGFEQFDLLGASSVDKDTIVYYYNEFTRRCNCFKELMSL